VALVVKSFKLPADYAALMKYRSKMYSSGAGGGWEGGRGRSERLLLLVRAAYVFCVPLVYKVFGLAALLSVPVVIFGPFTSAYL